MRAFVGVAFLFMQVGSLKPKGFLNQDTDNATECSMSEMRRLLSIVKTESFRKNPCLTEVEWLDFAMGVEDVEDVEEWFPLQERKNLSTCQKELMPTLLYIGLNHAGSTTIAKLLNMVPGWSMGAIKEPRFFSSTAHHYLRDVDDSRNRTRSLQEYRDEFMVSCDVHQTFDATPFYWALGNDKLHKHGFRYDPGATSLHEVQRLLGKDIKIVFTVKDPVAWLGSMDKIGNHEAEQLICMADSIAGWMSEFPRENFLFLDFAKIFGDLAGTIKQIVEFAGEPDFDPNQMTYNVDSGRRRNQQLISLTYADEYYTKFHACKERLQNLTGLTFEWGH